MRGFWRLSVTELRLLGRDPGSLFFMIAFPALLLVLNGANARPERFVPGYLAMIVAIGGLSALPGVVATYRERKVLRRLAVTPISPFAVLAAQVAAQFLMALAGAAVVIAVGALGLGMRAPAHPGPLALAFVLSVLMCCAAGFVIAALAPRARTADLLGLLVMFPMIFLAGAAVPGDWLPGELRELGEHMPLTQAVIAMRESWSGTPTLTPFLLLSGIIVLGTAVAAALFRWE
ncbi:ABC transporter permease [Nonomuraea zeae]|uniref:Transport permease protein n=1 Tax=Nonomuraea zeae TaxID=1642303 RepID=A0A5S4FTQ5_9ACTN|nr:ABC transporter permease [Nonomuraea zeae]TMR24002.1 ABC transporter permease [Nonomuraea zeae]